MGIRTGALASRREHTMIKVLIVEDDEEKRSAVLAAIGLVPKSSTISITEVSTILDAKERMLTTTFDLCILDVRLPNRSNESPKPKGGVELANLVCSSPRYKRPKSIIALTAYEESRQETIDAFAGHNVVVLHYDRSVAGWEATIIGQIEQLLTNSLKSVEEFDFDVCIITALQDPELNAVLRLEYGWISKQCPSDSKQFYEGSLTVHARTMRIAAMAAPQMGMAAASVLASRMIHEFKPRFLLMAGIAAGVRDEVAYGDILVADPSFDQDSGKIKDVDGVSTFLPDPLPLRLDPYMHEIVRSIMNDETSLGAIRTKWSGPKPEHVLRARLGPLATGATVLATDGSLEETRGNWRKLIGLDLETYGVFCAAEYFGSPKPLALSAKSVTDFADGNKDDKWREYASYTSASFIDLVIKRIAALPI